MPAERRKPGGGVRKRKARRAPHGPAEALSESLASSIGHRFRDPNLLLRALTHPSYAHERACWGQSSHYESLEFLGDAVLGFMVAELIYRHFPEHAEGQMSALRASLVSARSLAQRAEALGLGQHLMLGKGERATGGPTKRSILADVFESLLAAIYLDGGARAARAFVRRQFGAAIRESPSAPPQPHDFKTRLQELLQALGHAPPVYRLVAELGPPHRRSFEVEVLLPEGRFFRAAGSSKKQAEQGAAERALHFLKTETPPVLRGE